jgi:3-oxoacyl-[acyl-carrier protein] reductase
MIEDLKNKVVLITGAGTGIGAAAARAFGRNGCKVTVHYNKSAGPANGVAADIKKSGGDAVLMQADITKPDAAKKLIDDTVTRFGRIDVLINNAGDMVGRKALTDVSDDYLDEVLHLNVHSVVRACRDVVPHMRKQGGGNIINLSSIAARHGGGGGAVIYAAAKGFVATVTRGFAKELAKDNIRVNAVSPGVILTPFHERHSNEQQIETMRQTVPLGRCGVSDDCVGAFLFLASDQLSGYVTGQMIEVNGGQLMP